ncbi:MAG: septal ring lytic transglycosylase RlpA family protein [Woeseiaceae bacterium]
MRFKNKQHLYLLFVIPFLLPACSSSRYKINQDHGPSNNIDVSDVKNAIPKAEPRSKYGNPKNYKVLGKWYSVLPSSQGYRKKGLASWYGKKFHGHRTSSGETYNMYAMTAAHKTLPLPTYVRVTHLENGKSVIVKVNDRGPFHENRIIDLSYSAAKKLGVTAKGTGKVEVVAINPETYKSATTNHSQPYQDKFNRPSLISTLPVKTQFQLFLQVGAFSEEKNSRKLLTRLHRIFKKRQIHSEFISGKNIYRVRIGPLANITEADKLSVFLNNKGIPSTKIVID